MIQGNSHFLKVQAKGSRIEAVQRLATRQLEAARNMERGEMFRMGCLYLAT